MIGSRGCENRATVVKNCLELCSELTGLNIEWTRRYELHGTCVAGKGHHGVCVLSVCACHNGVQALTMSRLLKRMRSMALQGARSFCLRLLLAACPCEVTRVLSLRASRPYPLAQSVMMTVPGLFNAPTQHAPLALRVFPRCYAHSTPLHAAHPKAWRRAPADALGNEHRCCPADLPLRHAEAALTQNSPGIIL